MYIVYTTHTYTSRQHRKHQPGAKCLPNAPSDSNRMRALTFDLPAALKPSPGHEKTDHARRSGVWSRLVDTS